MLKWLKCKFQFKINGLKFIYFGVIYILYYLLLKLKFRVGSCKFISNVWIS